MMQNPYNAPKSALEEAVPQTMRFRSMRFRIARFLSISYLFLAAALCAANFFSQSEQFAQGEKTIEWLFGVLFGVCLLFLLMAAPLYYFLKATKKTAIGGVKKAFRWNVIIAVCLCTLCVAVFLPMGRLGLGLATFAFMALPQMFNAYCLFREEDTEGEED